MSIILAYNAPDSHDVTYGTLEIKNGDTLVFFGDVEVSFAEFCKSAWKHIRAAREEVEYMGYTLPAKDFVEAINYVLTTTDLCRKDPRLPLVKQIQLLKGKKPKLGPWGALVLSTCLLKKIPGRSGGLSRRLGVKK